MCDETSCMCKVCMYMYVCDVYLLCIYTCVSDVYLLLCAVFVCMCVCV